MRPGCRVPAPLQLEPVAMSWEDHQQPHMIHQLHTPSTAPSTHRLLFAAAATATEPAAGPELPEASPREAWLRGMEAAAAAKWRRRTSSVNSATSTDCSSSAASAMMPRLAPLALHAGAGAEACPVDKERRQHARMDDDGPDSSRSTSSAPLTVQQPPTADADAAAARLAAGLHGCLPPPAFVLLGVLGGGDE